MNDQVLKIPSGRAPSSIQREIRDSLLHLDQQSSRSIDGLAARLADLAATGERVGYERAITDCLAVVAVLGDASTFRALREQLSNAREIDKRDQEYFEGRAPEHAR